MEDQIVPSLSLGSVTWSSGPKVKPKGNRAGGIGRFNSQSSTARPYLSSDDEPLINITPAKPAKNAKPASRPQLGTTQPRKRKAHIKIERVLGSASARVKDSKMNDSPPIVVKPRKPRVKRDATKKPRVAKAAILQQTPATTITPAERQPSDQHNDDCVMLDSSPFQRSRRKILQFRSSIA